MKRLVTAVVIVVLGVAGLGQLVGAANLKPIHTQKTKDLVISLMSESGQWKPGKNSFGLEFASAKDKQPVDVGKVTLSTSMAMPGMAPMVAGATVTPEKPGRYAGMIQFPDGGTRQVTINWDGPAGKGSTKFSVPVR